MSKEVIIIGGGLAGCECAYQLLSRGVKVTMFEMKSTKFSPAHKLSSLAELVCSNSLKSEDVTTSSGLLKSELMKFDSLLLKIANECRVPAGNALAVDRLQFSQNITKQLENFENFLLIHKEIQTLSDVLYYTDKDENISLNSTNNIDVVNQKLNKSDVDFISNNVITNTMDNTLNISDNEITNTMDNSLNKSNSEITNTMDNSLNKSDNEITNTMDNSLNRSNNIDLSNKIIIIATGPLTSDDFSKSIKEFVGDDLYFFDAIAPIIDTETIDFDIAFIKDRYDKKDKDYINLPFNKLEYELFYNELINAEIVELKDFEKSKVYEGCMPIEVLAKRGIDTMRFGPLKPVGLINPHTNKLPYAVVQLRKESLSNELYNMVGFQTNLKFNEQKRIFRLIPGLKNAEFYRYGTMHKNTYINSPKYLNNHFQLISKPSIFFAGQISGVEGYVESIASGLMVGINVYNLLVNKKLIDFGNFTLLGALSNYISNKNNINFQPISSNFGLINNDMPKIKDKKQKNLYIANRSLDELELLKKEYSI